MQSSRWFLNRLRAMSPAEVGHRLGKLSRARLERTGILGASKSPPANLDELDDAPYISVPGITPGAYVAAGERVLAGKLDVFCLSDIGGQDPIQWNKDLLTGVVAPLRFGKSVDYRDERLVGNIKYVWEPNRHLEMVTLAQAYALSKEEKFIDGIGRRLESWFEQCPYPSGVNWCSSLELGIRLINWSLTWHLIGGRKSALFAGAEGRNRLERWMSSVYQHAHFISHYYSRYSSANNHLIGEAAGVFVASCTWPCWDKLADWGTQARALLIATAEQQTHADGVNREQAVSYQQFVLDFFVFSLLAGRARGIKFPNAYLKQLERMTDFLNSLMDVGGNVPMIGDADDGYVARLSQEPDFNPYRSLLNTGATLFGRPDLAAKGGTLDDKTRFLLGDPPGYAELAHERGCDPRRGRAFPDGGYYIFGDRLETDREIRVIADAGPLGYLSIAAHGHADALAIVLSAAGREVLVDPGTYSYHTERVWRDYFRGTGAHNTVRIDGQDQSVSGGNFLWLRHARARCLEFYASGTGTRFVGEHDGYCRLPDPVVHCREINQSGNIIRILDRLMCRGAHLAEQCWHFSEHCQVRLEEGKIVARNENVVVTITVPAGVHEVRHLRGSEDPPGGWISRRFDVKVPSDSVYFVREIDGTTELKNTIQIDIR